MEYLYNEIANILGLHEKHHLVLIGAGNLGQAIANYMNFERRGFLITGIFDVNKEIIGKKIKDITVLPMTDLEQFVKDNAIDIGVLTIPKSAAKEVADRLVACGVYAIWNFAHVDLDVPDYVLVENVHLSESLMKLSYNIHRKSK